MDDKVYYDTLNLQMVVPFAQRYEYQLLKSEFISRFVNRVSRLAIKGHTGSSSSSLSSDEQDDVARSIPTRTSTALDKDETVTPVSNAQVANVPQTTTKVSKSKAKRLRRKRAAERRAKKEDPWEAIRKEKISFAAQQILDHRKLHQAKLNSEYDKLNQRAIQSTANTMASLAETRLRHEKVSVSKQHAQLETNIKVQEHNWRVEKLIQQKRQQKARSDDETQRRKIQLATIVEEENVKRKQLAIRKQAISDSELEHRRRQFQNERVSCCNNLRKYCSCWEGGWD